MKKYAYKIYESILRNPLRRDTVHKVNCFEDDISQHYLMYDYTVCDDITDFINVAKFTPIKNLEMTAVSELDFRKVVRLASRYLTEISIYSTVSDLTVLSECKKLQKIHISSRTPIVTLPEIKSLAQLSKLELSLEANELRNVDSLASDSLAELRIYAGYRSGFAVIDARIEDLSFLLKMPKLKRLTLMLKGKEDPYNDLLVLSKLTELDELQLAPDYFNKEEYAWLASKLPHTRGLDGCYHLKKDRQKDCLRYIMLGENEDMIFEDGSRVEEYYKSYKKLVEDFKNQPTPPKRA